MLAKPKTLLTRYQYDALDRLAVHGQPDRLASKRFYCESRLATEIQGNVRHSITQYGDQLLAQQKQDSGRLESMLLATDLQRSVLTALSANSPRASAYSPYGHRPGKDGWYSLLGFSGQRSDPVTGHYLLGNGYRAFNPGLMRFNSPDSLSPFGKGGVNAYAYCEGDPINRDDASGHFFQSTFKGGALGARLASLRRGYRVKPVRNVTRISEGVITFEDDYKGGLRLTVNGHGTKDGRLVFGNDEYIYGYQLYDRAGSLGIDFKKYNSVRMVMCYSADKVPTSDAFGVALSVRIKLPVKAYHGPVRATNFTPFHRRLKVGETAKGTFLYGVVKHNNYLKLTRSTLNPVNHRPVTIDVWAAVRKAENIRS